MQRSSTTVRAWEEKSTTYFRALKLESIRSKLLMFAVLATLIPSLSTALISYIQNKRALTDKITATLQGTGSQAERELDLWLRGRLYDLRVFSSSYEVTENLERLSSGATGASMRRLNDYLGSVKGHFADYEELLVLDPQGHVVTTTGRSTPGGGGSVQLPSNWQRDARTDDPIVGHVQRDSATGQLFMTVAVPINSNRRLFLGLLAARLNLRAVNEVLAGFAARSSGYLYVVTNEGLVITASPDPGIAPGVTRLDEAALDQLSEDEGTAVEYSGLDGSGVVGTLRRIRRLRWAVIAEIPAAEAYQQVIRLRNLTALVVLGLLVIVGGLAYFLANLIVQPLDRLTRGAAKVAGGDLTVDLPVGGGEVGFLTQVFNEMVSRLRTKTEELERLSTTDALTGLHNRRQLMTTLEGETRRGERNGRRFSLLMVDIDHFKDYNDRHGHLAGDEALKLVGTAIKDTIRTVDAAARYGGEEFAVVLTDTELTGGAEVAERIRGRLGKETFEGGKITLSVGVAEFPTHGKTTQEMLAAADAALYQAKEAGRDRVVRAGESRASTRRSRRAEKT